jgi:FSR family fosmidomycin resistance protein-like MFS transporter
MARDTAAESVDRTETGAAGELNTLAVVSSAHLVSHLHIMVLPVMLHLLRDRLQVGYFELGLAIAAFSVVSGLTQAPMGVLVDRIGGRAVLAAGLVLGGAAFASLSVFGSYTWLIAAAVLAGLANGVYHPADYSILNDTVSERRMGRAFSVHTFAGFAGGALAPPLLLGMAAWAGAGAAFVTAGAFAWTVAALVLLVPASASVRPAGTAATAPAKVGLRDVLTPTILGLALFFTLLGLSGSAMSTFAIAALIAGHGVSSEAATAGLTAYLTASALGVLAGGPVADRTSRHGAVAAAGFAVAAMLALAIAAMSLPVPVLVVAMGLTGFLYGIVQPARDMLVRKAAPPGASGRVFGIVSTGFNIGGIVGPALFGLLMDQGMPRWIFGSAVIFMTATALLGLLEERRASAPKPVVRGA